MRTQKNGLSVATLAFALAFGLQTTAVAGTSLLDQGSSLLNSLNTSKTESSSSRSTSSTSSSDSLSSSEIVSGLKQALETGSSTVVGQLGTQNGFNSDSAIHIPLPSGLSKAKALMDQTGLGSYAEEVELKLNRAAEAATPKAKELFVKAITEMTFSDATSILNGEDDAATQYFKKKMSPDLTEAFTPVVEDSLGEVGAVRAYDAMVAQYKTMPFVPDIKGNLTSYTVEKTLDGIFYYLAKEEKAIRENPAKQTTALLKKLFN
ncbi:DUF4197 domain-containing protein [Desulfobulbus rhabdoformis]|uniref:DUF4197 domain-containing protein n=1 Tax=Desulfobulbus rhabdoformis TaxID=34032 RepID=UPI00196648EB|nr:DUF4197 domain-containing protein [Desulfobulbus rhabdoformis]MBM9612972.1 DUF4197 domain-containing protein [Desulfobulbus rhabdoformis]